MRSLVQFGFGQLLIVACALHLAICQDWCRDDDDGDNVAADCPGKENYFAVEVNEGCRERLYCYRRLNQTCDQYQTESRCEPGLTCSCGRCMNCDKHDRCYMELCPHYNMKKRMPLFPWYLPRWLQVLSRYKYPPPYL